MTHPIQETAMSAETDEDRRRKNGLYRQVSTELAAFRLDHHGELWDGRRNGPAENEQLPGRPFDDLTVPNENAVNHDRGVLR